MKKALLVVGAVIAAVVGTRPAQAQGYRYRFVDYPGAAQTEVYGINDRGAAVGLGIDSTGAYYVTFQYDSMKGRFTAVPQAPGYSATAVLGINDYGVMVGAVTSLDGTSFSGFIRGGDGAVKVFRQPGWANSQARGINAAGLVCGWSYSTDGNSSTGFIYDPRRDSYISVLPSPTTIVAGINDRGDIAGSAYLFGDAAYPGSPEGVYAFVRSAGGHVTLFRVNGQPTRARGINDSGVVTGFLNDPTLGFKGFATKLQAAPGYQDVSIADAKLLANPLGNATRAVAIANTGAVSGTALDAAGNSHGFVAMPADH